jgi:octaprenyl-diphosphate synthase
MGAAQPATLLKVLDPIANELLRVEELLVEQTADFDPGITDYVKYVLGASGKRLRPGLALLAGGATGEISDGHVKLGVIVELIHVATLVHDDVLDSAEVRHALATSNARWGNTISVLLGDCLFAHALKLAASFPTAAICRSVSQATNTVCAGEILQTRKRFDPNLTVEQYLAMINMKTGALFAVSCELGAMLNAAAVPVVKRLHEFGSNLGIAYQIYDDCVDIFGQERQAGKSLGTDIKTGKLTLPLLLLLQHVSNGERQDIAQMISQRQQNGRAELARMFFGNGVIDESLATIHRFIARAEMCLAELPGNVYSQTFSTLLHFVSDRSRTLLNEEVAT